MCIGSFTFLEVGLRITRALEGRPAQSETVATGENSLSASPSGPRDMESRHQMGTEKQMPFYVHTQHVLMYIGAIPVVCCIQLLTRSRKGSAHRVRMYGGLRRRSLSRMNACLRLELDDMPTVDLKAGGSRDEYRPTECKSGGPTNSRTCIVLKNRAGCLGHDSCVFSFQ